MALSKKYRIAKKKEIDYVFKNGRTVKNSFLFIRFVSNRRGFSRFAFMMPAKHIPLAVNRNKAKRMLLGVIERNLSLAGKGYDMVVLMSKRMEKSQLKYLVEEFKEILSKTQQR